MNRKKNIHIHPHYFINSTLRTVTALLLFIACCPNMSAQVTPVKLSQIEEGKPYWIRFALGRGLNLSTTTATDDGDKSGVSVQDADFTDKSQVFYFKKDNENRYHIYTIVDGEYQYITKSTVNGWIMSVNTQTDASTLPSTNYSIPYVYDINGTNNLRISVDNSGQGITNNRELLARKSVFYDNTTERIAQWTVIPWSPLEYLKQEIDVVKDIIDNVEIGTYSYKKVKAQSYVDALQAEWTSANTTYSTLYSAIGNSTPDDAQLSQIQTAWSALLTAKRTFLDEAYNKVTAGNYVITNKHGEQLVYSTDNNYWIKTVSITAPRFTAEAIMQVEVDGDNYHIKSNNRYISLQNHKYSDDHKLLNGDNNGKIQWPASPSDNKHQLEFVHFDNNFVGIHFNSPGKNGTSPKWKYTPNDSYMAYEYNCGAKTSPFYLRAETMEDRDNIETLNPTAFWELKHVIIYHIIDNTGEQAIQTTVEANATLEVPQAVKSPLAVNWRFYKSLTDAQTDDPSTQIETGAGHADIYVRYDYDNSSSPIDIDGGTWYNWEFGGNRWMYSRGPSKSCYQWNSPAEHVKLHDQMMWKFTGNDPYRIIIVNKAYQNLVLTKTSKRARNEEWLQEKELDESPNYVQHFIITQYPGLETWQIIGAEEPESIDNSTGEFFYVRNYQDDSGNFNDGAYIVATNNFQGGTPATQLKFTPFREYTIVDNTGHEAISYTVPATDQLEVPQPIKSPLAKNWRYYDTLAKAQADNKNIKLTTAKDNATIYVRYDYDNTHSPIDINGSTWYNWHFAGGENRYAYNRGTGNHIGLTNNPSAIQKQSDNYQWHFSGNDPYRITISTRALPDKIVTKRTLRRSAENELWISNNDATDVIRYFALTQYPGKDTYQFVACYKPTEFEASTGRLFYIRYNSNGWPYIYADPNTQDGHEWLQMDFGANKSWHIIDLAGNEVLNSTHNDNGTLQVPNSIRSALATNWTFYSNLTDAKNKTNPISSTRDYSDIYARYEYHKETAPIDLSGEVNYYMKFPGGYAMMGRFSDNSNSNSVLNWNGLWNAITTIPDGTTHPAFSEYTHYNNLQWRFTGNDPYHVKVHTDVRDMSNSLMSNGENNNVWTGTDTNKYDEFMFVGGDDGKFQLFCQKSASDITKLYFHHQYQNAGTQVYLRANSDENSLFEVTPVVTYHIINKKGNPSIVGGGYVGDTITSPAESVRLQLPKAMLTPLMSQDDFKYYRLSQFDATELTAGHYVLKPGEEGNNITLYSQLPWNEHDVYALYDFTVTDTQFPDLSGKADYNLSFRNDEDHLWINTSTNLDDKWVNFGGNGTTEETRHTFNYKWRLAGEDPYDIHIISRSRSIPISSDWASPDNSNRLFTAADDDPQTTFSSFAILRRPLTSAEDHQFEFVASTPTTAASFTNNWQSPWLYMRFNNWQLQVDHAIASGNREACVELTDVSSAYYHIIDLDGYELANIKAYDLTKYEVPEALRSPIAVGFRYWDIDQFTTSTDADGKTVFTLKDGEQDILSKTPERLPTRNDHIYVTYEGTNNLMLDLSGQTIYTMFGNSDDPQLMGEFSSGRGETFEHVPYLTQRDAMVGWRIYGKPHGNTFDPYYAKFYNVGYGRHWLNANAQMTENADNAAWYMIVKGRDNYYELIPHVGYVTDQDPRYVVAGEMVYNHYEIKSEVRTHLAPHIQIYFQPQYKYNIINLSGAKAVEIGEERKIDEGVTLPVLPTIMRSRLVQQYHYYDGSQVEVRHGSYYLKDDATEMHYVSDAIDGKIYVFYDRSEVKNTIDLTGQKSYFIHSYNNDQRFYMSADDDGVVTYTDSPDANNDKDLWLFLGDDPYDLHIYNMSKYAGVDAGPEESPWLSGNGTYTDDIMRAKLLNTDSRPVNTFMLVNGHEDNTFAFITSYKGIDESDLSQLGSGYRSYYKYLSMNITFKDDGVTLDKNEVGIWHAEYEESHRWIYTNNQFMLEPQRPAPYTYHVVNKEGDVAVSMTIDATMGSAPALPATITSPLATDYKYYTLDGEGNYIPLARTASERNIYVKDYIVLTDEMSLDGSMSYFLTVGNKYIHAQGTDIVASTNRPTDVGMANDYLWTIDAGADPDPYNLRILLPSADGMQLGTDAGENQVVRLDNSAAVNHFCLLRGNRSLPAESNDRGVYTLVPAMGRNITAETYANYLSTESDALMTLANTADHQRQNDIDVQVIFQRARYRYTYHVINLDGEVAVVNTVSQLAGYSPSLPEIIRSACANVTAYYDSPARNKEILLLPFKDADIYLKYEYQPHEGSDGFQLDLTGKKTFKVKTDGAVNFIYDNEDIIDKTIQNSDANSHLWKIIGKVVDGQIDPYQVTLVNRQNPSLIMGAYIPIVGNGETGGRSNYELMVPTGEAIDKGKTPTANYQYLQSDLTEAAAPHLRSDMQMQFIGIPVNTVYVVINLNGTQSARISVPNEVGDLPRIPKAIRSVQVPYENFTYYKGNGVNRADGTKPTEDTQMTKSTSKYNLAAMTKYGDDERIQESDEDIIIYVGYTYENRGQQYDLGGAGAYNIRFDGNYYLKTKDAGSTKEYKVETKRVVGEPDELFDKNYMWRFVPTYGTGGDPYNIQVRTIYKGDNWPENTNFMLVPESGFNDWHRMRVYPANENSFKNAVPQSFILVEGDDEGFVKMLTTKTNDNSDFFYIGVKNISDPLFMNEKWNQTKYYELNLELVPRNVIDVEYMLWRKAIDSDYVQVVKQEAVAGRPISIPETWKRVACTYSYRTRYVNGDYIPNGEDLSTSADATHEMTLYPMVAADNGQDNVTLRVFVDYEFDQSQSPVLFVPTIEDLYAEDNKAKKWNFLQMGVGEGSGLSTYYTKYGMTNAERTFIDHDNGRTQAFICRGSDDTMNNARNDNTMSAPDNYGNQTYTHGSEYLTCLYGNRYYKSLDETHKINVLTPRNDFRRIAETFKDADDANFRESRWLWGFVGDPYGFRLINRETLTKRVVETGDTIIIYKQLIARVREDATRVDGEGNPITYKKAVNTVQLTDNELTEDDIAIWELAIGDEAEPNGFSLKVQNEDAYLCTSGPKNPRLTHATLGGVSRKARTLKAYTWNWKDNKYKHVTVNIYRDKVEGTPVLTREYWPEERTFMAGDKIDGSTNHFYLPHEDDDNYNPSMAEDHLIDIPFELKRHFCTYRVDGGSFTVTDTDEQQTLNLIYSVNEPDAIHPYIPRFLTENELARFKATEEHGTFVDDRGNKHAKSDYYFFLDIGNRLQYHALVDPDKGTSESHPYNVVSNRFERKDPTQLQWFFVGDPYGVRLFNVYFTNHKGESYKEKEFNLARNYHHNNKGGEYGDDQEEYNRVYMEEVQSGANPQEPHGKVYWEMVEPRRKSSTGHYYREEDPNISYRFSRIKDLPFALRMTKPHFWDYPDEVTAERYNNNDNYKTRLGIGTAFYLTNTPENAEHKDEPWNFNTYGYALYRYRAGKSDPRGNEIAEAVMNFPDVRHRANMNPDDDKVTSVFTAMPVGRVYATVFDHHDISNKVTDFELSDYYAITDRFKGVPANLQREFCEYDKVTTNEDMSGENMTDSEGYIEITSGTQHIFATYQETINSPFCKNIQGTLYNTDSNGQPTSSTSIMWQNMKIGNRWAFFNSNFRGFDYEDGSENSSRVDFLPKYSGDINASAATTADDWRFRKGFSWALIGDPYDFKITNKRDITIGEGDKIDGEYSSYTTTPAYLKQDDATGLLSINNESYAANWTLVRNASAKLDDANAVFFLSRSQERRTEATGPVNSTMMSTLYNIADQTYNVSITDNSAYTKTDKIPSNYNLGDNVTLQPCDFITYPDGTNNGGAGNEGFDAIVNVYNRLNELVATTGWTELSRKRSKWSLDNNLPADVRRWSCTYQLWADPTMTSQPFNSYQDLDENGEYLIKDGGIVYVTYNYDEALFSTENEYRWVNPFFNWDDKKKTWPLTNKDVYKYTAEQWNRTVMEGGTEHEYRMPEANIRKQNVDLFMDTEKPVVPYEVTSEGWIESPERLNEEGLDDKKAYAFSNHQYKSQNRYKKDGEWDAFTPKEQDERKDEDMKVQKWALIGDPYKFVLYNYYRRSDAYNDDKNSYYLRYHPATGEIYNDALPETNREIEPGEPPTSVYDDPDVLQGVYWTWKVDGTGYKYKKRKSGISEEQIETTQDSHVYEVDGECSVRLRDTFYETDDEGNKTGELKAGYLAVCDLTARSLYTKGQLVGGVLGYATFDRTKEHIFTLDGSINNEEPVSFNNYYNPDPSDRSVFTSESYTIEKGSKLPRIAATYVKGNNDKYYGYVKRTDSEYITKDVIDSYGKPVYERDYYTSDKYTEGDKIGQYINPHYLNFEEWRNKYSDKVAYTYTHWEGIPGQKYSDGEERTGYYYDGGREKEPYEMQLPLSVRGQKMERDGKIVDYVTQGVEPEMEVITYKKVQFYTAVEKEDQYLKLTGGPSDVENKLTLESNGKRAYRFLVTTMPIHASSITFHLDPEDHGLDNGGRTSKRNFVTDPIRDYTSEDYGIGNDLMLPWLMRRQYCDYTYYLEHVEDAYNTTYIDDLLYVNNEFNNGRHPERGAAYEAFWKDAGEQKLTPAKSGQVEVPEEWEDKHIYIRVTYEPDQERWQSSDWSDHNPDRVHWYNLKTQQTEEMPQYLMQYTRTDHVTGANHDQKEHTTNDYLWAVEGDPYGFWLHNRYAAHWHNGNSTDDGTTWPEANEKWDTSILTTDYVNSHERHNYAGEGVPVAGLFTQSDVFNDLNEKTGTKPEFQADIHFAKAGVSNAYGRMLDDKEHIVSEVKDASHNPEDNKLYEGMTGNYRRAMMLHPVKAPINTRDENGIKYYTSYLFNGVNWPVQLNYLLEWQAMRNVYCNWVLTLPSAPQLLPYWERAGYGLALKPEVAENLQSVKLYGNKEDYAATPKVTTPTTIDIYSTLKSMRDGTLTDSRFDTKDLYGKANRDQVLKAAREIAHNPKNLVRMEPNGNHWRLVAYSSITDGWLSGLSPDRYATAPLHQGEAVEERNLHFYSSLDAGRTFDFIVQNSPTQAYDYSNAWGTDGSYNDNPNQQPYNPNNPDNQYYTDSTYNNPSYNDSTYNNDYNANTAYQREVLGLAPTGPTGKGNAYNATRGRQPVEAAPFDASSIYLTRDPERSNTTLHHRFWTMQTQGLGDGNGLYLDDTGASLGEVAELDIQDIGVTAVQIQSKSLYENKLPSKGTLRNDEAYDYLSYLPESEAYATKRGSELHKSLYDIYDTRWMLQPIGEDAPNSAGTSYQKPLSLRVYEDRQTGGNYYYASLYMPFDVQLQSGAVAYVPEKIKTIDENGEEMTYIATKLINRKMTTKKGNGFVPAGTGVIVRVGRDNVKSDYDINGNEYKYITMTLPTVDPATNSDGTKTIGQEVAENGDGTIAQAVYLEQELEEDQAVNSQKGLGIGPDSSKKQRVFVFGQYLQDDGEYSPVGFYLNANHNWYQDPEFSTIEDEWYRRYDDTDWDSNNRYVRHNKVYILVDEPITSPTKQRATVIPVLFDGDESNIVNIPSDSYWYTVSGIRLNGRPHVPGTYIHKGKKIYVK